MSLLNSPDPAVRAAVVQQDLGNVLHPIVQHKALEAKQMVVTRSEGSTIVDADGTEYLDGMAGLWCVNIGYGRSELAGVAADQMRQLSYFPRTAMNAPAAALAEKINELMGGGYHTYFVNSGSEANEAGFKIARQYQKHERPGESADAAESGANTGVRSASDCVTYIRQLRCRRFRPLVMSVLTEVF